MVSSRIPHCHRSQDYNNQHITPIRRSIYGIWVTTWLLEPSSVMILKSWSQGLYKIVLVNKKKPEPLSFLFQIRSTLFLMRTEVKSIYVLRSNLPTYDMCRLCNVQGSTNEPYLAYPNPSPKSMLILY